MRRSLVRDVFLLLSLCLLCTVDRCIGQLHIGSGTTWVSNSATTVVLGDLGLTYDATPVLLNNTFRFTGTHINTISGSTQPSLYAIGLAKTNPGALILNQSIDVKKRINFETGLFDLNGNNIFLDSSALLTNESELSRIIAPAGGVISIDIDLRAPVAADPGNLGAFITSATTLGKVNLLRGHQFQPVTDTSQSIARYYDLTTADNITIALDLRFNYFYAESEGFNNDSLSLWRSADAVKWTDIGYTTRDAGQKYVEKQGLNSLHRFTLSNGSTTSPPPPPPPAQGITLLTGHWATDVVVLNWALLSEYQNDHFTVERKYASEAAFTAIASAPTSAPGGTRSTPAAYTYTDSTVKKNPDDISYRIHQVATNGQSAYSNIITLKALDSSTEFIRKLYPTFVLGGRVYIEVGGMPLQKMSFAIIDAKGSIVLTGTLPYQSQWLPVNFLSRGVYRLLLRSGDQKFHSTFIK